MITAMDLPQAGKEKIESTKQRGGNLPLMKKKYFHYQPR
jgi:hypothetical protein